MSLYTSNTRCLIPHLQASQGKLPLICVPYAGGGAGVFRAWGGALAPSMLVHAVQWPGRESRFAEVAHVRMEPLVAELAHALTTRPLERYALFGHSMGALVAFELARELRRRDAPPPAALIVSAHRAPHLPRQRAPLHQLPEERFIEELRRMGGIPAEVLEHAELMALLVPRLRADFAVCETYWAQEPLSCPVFAFGGREDALVDATALSPWGEHTDGAFCIQMFDGGHFYLDQPDPALFPAMRAALNGGHRAPSLRCAAHA